MAFAAVPDLISTPAHLSRLTSRILVYKPASAEELQQLLQAGSDSHVPHCHTCRVQGLSMRVQHRPYQLPS